MDKIYISHFWLPPRDIKMVEHILCVPNDWLKNFELYPKANASGGEVALVNISNPAHWDRWEKVSFDKKFVLTIALVAKAEWTFPGAYSMKRPLVYKRFCKALEELSGSGCLENQNTDKPAILVVDDSLTVRTFMKQKLELYTDGKADIHLACDAEEGLSLCAQRNYGLVFMDVMMPGIDGYAACKAIKNSYSTTRVVMLTSRSSAFDKIKGRMCACDSFLVKPPRDPELMFEVRRFIRRNDELAQRQAQNKVANMP